MRLRVGFGEDTVLGLERALTELKGGDPMRPITVIVPHGYAGLHLRRRLASRTEKGWVNVRFLPLLRVAEMLGSSQMALRHKLTPHLLRQAVRRALREHPEAYGAVSSSESTVRSVASTVGDLLNAHANLDGIPRPELRTISLAVQQSLGEAFYTENDLYRAASMVVRDCPSCLQDLGAVVAIVSDDQRGSQGELLQALDASYLLVMNSHGNEMLEMWAETFGPLTGELPDPPSVSACKIVATADDEVRHVVAQILAMPEVPLPNVGIFTSEPSLYEPILRELLAAADLKATMRVRRTLSHTVTGQALLGMLERARGNWHVNSFTDWLGSTPFKAIQSRNTDSFERTSEALPPEPRMGFAQQGPEGSDSQSATPLPVEPDSDSIERTSEVPPPKLRRGSTRQKPGVSDSHRATPGKDADSYNPGAGCTPEQMTFASLFDPAPEQAPANGCDWGRLLRRARVSGDVRRAKPLLRRYGEIEPKDKVEVDRLIDFIGTLTTESVPPARGTWASWVNWADEWLVRRIDSSAVNPEEWSSVRAALDRAKEFRRVDPEVSLPSFAAGLTDLLEEPFGEQTRFGEGVFVGGFGDAEGMSFDVAFLLGLCEGLAPRAAREDPVLPNMRYRQEAGLSLALESGWEQNILFNAARLSAPKVHVSCPRVNPTTGRECLPGGWYLLEACRASGASLSASDLVASKPESLGDALFRRFPISKQERHLRDLLQTPQEEEAPWQGEMPAWDFEQPISISGLEQYAACPYRFFLKYRLKVEPNDQVDPERVVAPDEQGNLAHRTLRRFFEEIRIASPEQELTVEDHQRLNAILDEEALGLVRNGLVEASPLWDEQLLQLRNQLHTFLVEDEVLRRQLGTVPHSFERRFNEQFGPFQLRGVIDRLDLDSEGRPLPIDYKTGAARRPKAASKDPLVGGRLLQIPLYALIAERLLNSPPAIEGIYWRLEGDSEKDRAIHIPLDESVRAALHENLNAWAEGLSGGLFPPRPQLEGDPARENCASCPFDRICPSDREEIWERARLDPRLSGIIAVETRTRLEGK